MNSIPKSRFSGTHGRLTSVMEFVRRVLDATDISTKKMTFFISRTVKQGDAIGTQVRLPSEYRFNIYDFATTLVHEAIHAEDCEKNRWHDLERESIEELTRAREASLRPAVKAVLTEKELNNWEAYMQEIRKFRESLSGKGN